MVCRLGGDPGQQACAFGVEVRVDELGREIGPAAAYAAGRALECEVPRMLREMLEGPYRRAKYKGGAESLKRSLFNLTPNVEWTVQRWL